MNKNQNLPSKDHLYFDDSLDEIATVALRSPFAPPEEGTQPTIDVQSFDPKKRILPGQFSQELSDFFSKNEGSEDKETIIAPEPSPVLLDKLPSLSGPISTASKRQEIDQTVYWDESPVARFKALRNNYSRQSFQASSKVKVAALFVIAVAICVVALKAVSSWTNQAADPTATPAVSITTAHKTTAPIAPSAAEMISNTPETANGKTVLTPTAQAIDEDVVLKQAIDALLEGRLNKASALYRALATQKPDDETLALTLDILSRIPKESSQ